MSTSQSQSSSGSLTCQHVLSPPLCHVGHGVNSIQYSSDAPAWQCCFSRDGKHLAVCYGAPDPCVRVWKLLEDEWLLQATLSGIQDRAIRSVDFAPILKPLTLASASFDGTVAIWEYSDALKDWECTAQLEGHESEVKCVTWNATGSLLATCGRDKSVWVWECFLPGAIGGPDIKPVSGDQGGEFECLAVLNGHQGDVKCVRFAPSHGQWGDGDEILLSSSYDDTIKVWAEDAGDWYAVASISGIHTATIWSLSLSPSGTRLVSGSADGSLGIYKSYTSAEKKNMFQEEPQNRNGAWKCVGRLPDAHASAIYSVDYAPSKAGHGRVATGGADNSIRIFREAVGSSSDRPLFSTEISISSPQGDVNCVCWHPYDGSILATAGDDGTVRLWKFKI